MAEAFITIQLTGNGKFKTGAALQGVIMESMALQEGATAMLGSLAAATPKVSGLGRASWELDGGAIWDGMVLRQKINNTASNKGIRYIGRANRVSKRNAGFVQRGFQAGVGQVRSITASRLNGIKNGLWEKTL